MLLNIVKIRYGDTPVFLEVASVISQYSLEGELNASAGFSDGLLGNTQGIGGKAIYIDRPTVTYVPLTGARFTRSILRPIPIIGVSRHQFFLLIFAANVPLAPTKRIVRQRQFPDLACLSPRG